MKGMWGLSPRLSEAAPPVGLPADSLQTLLADLAALARHTVTTAIDPAPEFVVQWHLTQQKALDLPRHQSHYMYSPSLVKMLNRIIGFAD